VFAQAAEKGWPFPFERAPEVDLAPLVGAKELALAAKLAAYPDVLRQAAAELAPHQIAFYLQELAADFHGFYNAERVLVEQRDVREARLALAAATRQVLRNGLALLGVSAPERM
jgi:arginyl-tRNA synthetase